MKLFHSKSLKNLLIVCLCLASTWGCMNEEEIQMSQDIDEAQAEYAMTQKFLALSTITPDSTLAHTLQNQSVIYTNGMQSEIDLKEITAVTIDFKQIDPVDIQRNYADLLQTLQTSGGTVLIQNAEDSEMMASILGVGITADLAYIEMPTTHKHGLIHIYDHPLLSSKHVQKIKRDNQPVEHISSINNEIDNAKFLVDEQAAVSILSKLTNPYSVQTHALSASLASANYQQGSSFRSFYVNFEDYQWDFETTFADRGMNKANLDIDFWIYLIKAEGGDRPGQYLVVESTGGPSVDGLAHNSRGSAFSNGKVGPFQDNVEITVDVNGGGMDFYESAPETSNGSNIFESTTGFGIGFDSSGVLGASLDSSTTVTTELPHFDVHSTRNGERVTVKWQMESSTGGSYKVENPLSLVNNTWGGLHGVYDLSHGSFSTLSEHVYRSSLGNTSNINISLGTKQRLVQVKTKTYFFSQYSEWKSFTANRSTNISVNFNQLNTGVSDVNIR